MNSKESTRLSDRPCIRCARNVSVYDGTRMRRLLMSFFFVLLLSAFLISPISAEETLATGVVYVESNIATPNGNSILAYRRDEAGRLTPLPGSPFPTGGAGVGDPAFESGPSFDSDQNIVINPEGTRLFAVNSGSNSIAVFDIDPDGGLTPVASSPFPSGGVNPVSVGLAGDKLYVVNMNMDPAQDQTRSLPNYTGFQVSPGGQLTPIPGSTVEVPAGSAPTQALISPDHQVLFGADFLGLVLQAFRIAPDGRLLQSPNTPQPLPESEFKGRDDAARAPLGLQVHPKQSLLYVGFVTIDKLGVYSYDSLGALTFLHTAPNSGKAICWFAINQAGTCLYSANTADNSISAYDLADPTTPVEIQQVTLRGNGGPLQMALDPAEEFLHVVNQRLSADTPMDGNALHILKVNATDCTLTEVPSSPRVLPVPDGTRPQGVAAK